MDKTARIAMLVVIVVLAITAGVWSVTQFRVASQDAVLESGNPIPSEENRQVVNQNIFQEDASETSSFSYLFAESAETGTSNIVGYLGYRAFAWYVPDWLATNWMETSAQNSADIIFAPRIRANNSDFSDIIFNIRPSTEAHNALILFEMEKQSGNRADIVIDEVLLNQHDDGMLSIIMETNTRIYHIQKTSAGQTKDFYYIDGNNQTLTITFEARSAIFHQFAPKIRDLVGGIGELKTPQG